MKRKKLKLQGHFIPNSHLDREWGLDYQQTGFGRGDTGQVYQGGGSPGIVRLDVLDQRRRSVAGANGGQFRVERLGSGLHFFFQ